MNFKKNNSFQSDKLQCLWDSTNKIYLIWSILLSYKLNWLLKMRGWVYKQKHFKDKNNNSKIINNGDIGF